VVPGSGAAQAGLVRGDIVTRLNDRPMDTAEALVAATSALLPGDAVTLTVQRANKTEVIQAVLGSVSNTLSSYRARYQDQLGGPLSVRRVLFPSALEHDSVLSPHQCGGPLVGLDGKAIGINIARASRVATYAIPARVARPLLEAFKTRTMVTVSTQASRES
jgi:serine protease Do